jgi:hypothetical protein
VGLQRAEMRFRQPRLEPGWPCFVPYGARPNGDGARRETVNEVRRDKVARNLIAGSTASHADDRGAARSNPSAWLHVTEPVRLTSTSLILIGSKPGQMAEDISSRKEIGVA